jgi:hypothetical protein
MNIVPPENPENEDFHVDLSFSGRDKNYVRPAGLIIAALAIVFIVLTMTTDLASRILPMSDEYLLALIPVAPDGAEPLSLKSLEQEIMDKTINIRGTMANRTDYTISNILAVFDLQETTGRFPQTVEVPVEPVELAPQAVGGFQARATLQEKPAGYLVKFRLADGPFVPHKDDRASTFGITVK